MGLAIPAIEIAGCRTSHQRLREAVAKLTEDQVRAPSRLPERSVAELLTHVARNADSIIRRLEGARRSEVVDQYEGGVSGKFAEIQRGATRPARELIDDVVATAAAVDAAFDAFPARLWSRPARSTNGEEHPVSALTLRRWRDVELHLVDLGLGHSPADWPDDLIARCIPDLVDDLPRRTDGRALMAWALLRGPAPELDGNDLGGWCFSAKVEPQAAVR